jgi:PAS domain S-box-containing protein
LADIEQNDEPGPEGSDFRQKSTEIPKEFNEQKSADIILEIMNEVFFELNQKDNILRVNKKAESFCNRDRNELIGHCLWEIFPQAIDTPLHDLIRRAQDQKLSISMDILSPLNRWAHVSVAPTPNGVIVLFYDIQNEKEAEQKLSESEAQWRRLVQNTPDMITRWDTDLKLIYGNQAYEEKAGTTLLSILGKNSLEMGHPPEIATPWMEKLREVIATKKPVDHFYFYPMDSGNCYYYARLAPECDEDQVVQSVLAIARDITELKAQDEHVRKVNETLLQKNFELETKHKELTSLSHVASRELKEPLRRVYTAIEWIVSNDVKNLSNGGKANFRRLQAAVQKMGLITDDMLSFINISKDFENEHTIVDLNKVLEEAKTKIGRLITEKDARIRSQELPLISGNAAQLTELFKNILHNAIKFQAKGNVPEIEIFSSFVKEDESLYGKKENQKYLKLSFKDNGIGFDSEHGEDIFHLFTKLHSPEEFRGMGMGLALCKKIMVQHNGFIHATSSAGNGSVFDCFFPI